MGGKAARAWLVPISMLLLLQTSSSFLNRIIPIISPAMTREFGWDNSFVGYLTAFNNFGALAALLTCLPLMRRIGSIRTLQFSLLAGSAGVVLFFFPLLTLALLGALITGLSQGISNPAGSNVLQRFSPPGKRNLMFSIKQSGVPLGGVVAGLIVPPLVLLTGWRGALAGSGLLVALGIWLTWRGREQTDEPPGERKAPPRRRGFFYSVVQPLRVMSARPGMMSLAWAGVLLSACQACWFAFMVTYLVVKLGYTLTLAGLVFAIMQTCSVAGRVVLGWLADRTRDPRVILVGAGWVACAATVLMALAAPDWPLWAVMTLSAVAGASVAGWNGVQVAEIARLSAPGQVAETSAGASILFNGFLICSSPVWSPAASTPPPLRTNSVIALTDSSDGIRSGFITTSAPAPSRTAESTVSVYTQV
jgi:MFS family permease